MSAASATATSSGQPPAGLGTGPASPSRKPTGSTSAPAFLPLLVWLGRSHAGQASSSAFAPACVARNSTPNVRPASVVKGDGAAPPAVKCFSQSRQCRKASGALLVLGGAISAAESAHAERPAMAAAVPLGQASGGTLSAISSSAATCLQASSIGQLQRVSSRGAVSTPAMRASHT